MPLSQASSSSKKFASYSSRLSWGIRSREVALASPFRAVALPAAAAAALLVAAAAVEVENCPGADLADAAVVLLVEVAVVPLVELVEEVGCGRW